MTVSNSALGETELGVPWLVTPEKVHAAVERIVATAKPQVVVLFGSYVRREAQPDSDLDVLVIVDDSVINCRVESVRLRRALRGISMPIDIIVARQSDVERLRHTSGLLYETALNEGQLVYERR